jgi:NAD-dependent SIR2 family protein deacetylase
LNGEWLERRSGAEAAESAPDGDAELGPAELDGFRLPGCDACEGVVKPDVVLFGENVPRERVERAWSLFEEARVLLVVGSSLTVFSGRRFILGAQKRGVPVAVVNLGPTRADDVAAAKVEGRLGDVLPRVADALLGEGARHEWR